MKKCICLLSLVALFAPNMSEAKEKKLKAFEKRLDRIEKQYLTNNQGAAKAIATAEEMQRERAELKGAISGNRHLIEAQHQNDNKHFHDIDQRLRALEERIMVMSDQVAKVLTKISPKLASEGKAYQQALNKVEEGAHLEAASSFHKFVNKYPRSKYVPQARFWIAESHFRSRNFKKAIQTYQRFIDKHPKHEKVKAAMLYQAKSFYELGLKDEATLFLSDLETRFPKTNEAKEGKLLLSRIENESTAGTFTPNNGKSSYPEQTLQEMRGKNQAQNKDNEKVKSDLDF